MNTQTEIFADLSQPYAEELLLAEMRRALALLDYTRAAWDANPTSATLAKNWGSAVLVSQKTFKAAALAYKSGVQEPDEIRHKIMNEIADMHPVEVSREFLDGILRIAYRDAQSNNPTKNQWLFEMIFPPGLEFGLAVADIVYRAANAVLESGAGCHPEISELNAQVRNNMNSALIAYPATQQFCSRMTWALREPHAAASGKPA